MKPKPLPISPVPQQVYKKLKPVLDRGKELAMAHNAILGAGVKSITCNKCAVQNMYQTDVCETLFHARSTVSY